MAAACRVLLAGLLMVGAIAARAAPLPAPPCTYRPQAPRDTPAVSVDDAAGWQPPECLGWGSGIDVLVTVAGTLPAAPVEQHLARIGQVSRLRDVRYWSVSDQRWRELVTQAAALDGPAGRQRPDFAAAELQAGKYLYFTQSDSRFSGAATYSLTVLERSPRRLVVSIGNVSTVRLVLVPLFSPGDLRATFFLDARPDGGWDYHAAWGLRTSRLTAGHEASTVNRAVAMYRVLAGIPTDQEPPAARR